MVSGPDESTPSEGKVLSSTVDIRDVIERRPGSCTTAGIKNKYYPATKKRASTGKRVGILSSFRPKRRRVVRSQAFRNNR